MTATAPAMASSAINGPTYTQTAGTTHLADGTLQAGSINIQSGLLSGNGTLSGPATINGTVSAGDSAGILVFVGSASFGGAIEVELQGVLVDGLSPVVSAVNVGSDPLATQFDQYNIFGHADLLSGLTIDVSLLGSFMPTTGNFFDVITADDLTADLGLLNFLFPSFSDGSTFIPTLVSFDGRDALRLTLVSGVPEPSTLALFLLAAFALVYGRRRVQHA